MLPVLASLIPSLVSSLAGPAALFGSSLGSIKEGSSVGMNPFETLVDSIFNGGSNRLTRLDSQRDYNFQREQFDWNKEQADLAREREDTAAQRGVADMRAAGLSPMAQFSGAAGATANGASASPTAMSMSPTNVLNGAIQILQLVQSLKMNNAQIDKTRAETASILANNHFNDVTFDSRVGSLIDQSSLGRAQLLDYLRDSTYSRQAGITASMPPELKLILGASHLAGLKSNNKLSYDDIKGLVTGSTDYTSTIPNLKAAVDLSKGLLNGSIKPEKINEAIEALNNGSDYSNANHPPVRSATTGKLLSEQELEKIRAENAKKLQNFQKTQKEKYSAKKPDWNKRFSH